MSLSSARLSIAIPTCNHPELVEQFIRHAYPSLIRHQLPVYISDNSNNTDTETMVQQLTLEYPHLKYRRNESNKGFDYNCLQAITWPETAYVWPIGDGMLINPDCIDQVMAQLDKGFDFIFLNYRIPHTSSQVIPFSRTHDWIVNNTWHLSCLGVTIFGERPRAMATNPSVIEWKKWEYFMHTGLILRFATQYPCHFYWIAPYGLSGNPHKKESGWVSIALTVFAIGWSRLIEGFSDVLTVDERRHMVRSHAEKTHIFEWPLLIHHRKTHHFNDDMWQAHARALTHAVPLPSGWLALLARSPRWTLWLPVWNLLLIWYRITEKMGYSQQY
ncbi:glycosyltransferase [bacterium]|nr:glycosyltransferase [bacterium]